MKIRVGFNTSDNNVVDKSITWEDTELVGAFREPVNLNRPTIRLTASYSATNPDLFVKWNYLKLVVKDDDSSTTYIRYYFVDEVIAVRAGVFDLVCHVDVLMTYKNAIRAQTALVSRQEKYWNLYLNDSCFRVQNNPNVTTQAFSGGFYNQSYVLVLAGVNEKKNPTSTVIKPGEGDGDLSQDYQ